VPELTPVAIGPIVIADDADVEPVPVGPSGDELLPLML